MTLKMWRPFWDDPAEFRQFTIWLIQEEYLDSKHDIQYFLAKPWKYRAEFKAYRLSLAETEQV